MLVLDYLEYVSSSEIKALSLSDIGGDNPNTIQQDNRDKLIGFLNLANIAVHKKFALIQKEFVLTDVTHNTTHPLPLDWMYPMNASFDDGTEVSINNERTNIIDGVDTRVSVLFPAPFTALVKGTDELLRNDISLVYVATPKKVSTVTEFIDLSDIYTEALLYYLAFKAYSSMQGDMQATNNTYYLRFLESCRDIEAKGLSANDNLDSNIKLEERGYA